MGFIHVDKTYDLYAVASINPHRLISADLWILATSLRYAGGGDCEGDFNVVGADVRHGFGEPCAVDCERLVHQEI